MKKISLSIVLLAGLVSMNVAFADCKKTLMGNDCESNASGVSSHMRGNAVANAKAAKELKATHAKAKKAAKAVAAAK